METTWVRNREKPKPADLCARFSATPPRPARDPDQKHRAQNGDASLSGLSIRSLQSPAAGPVCPSRTPGGAPSPSSQSRAAASRQRIGGRHSRRDQSNSDAGIRRPAEPGLFFCQPSQAWLQAFPPGLCACARPAAGGRGVRCSLPTRYRADAWVATWATMTDYGEEQRNELEALESIYPDSFTGDFGGRPRRGGGRGPSSLSPVSFQHPPAPFPTVLKSEGPGGSVEALELIPTALSSRNRKPSKIH